MRILIAAAVAAMTLCLSLLNVFSQGLDPLPSNGTFDSSAPVFPNLPRGPRGVPVPGGPFGEPRVLTKGPLAPSAQDRANQASFLKRRNTGLLRLVPRQPMTSSRQSSLASKPLVKINGGGAYYSFVHKSHEYGYGSDLELSSTYANISGTWLPSSLQLSVGFAGAAFGMLGNLGETPLEGLTIDDPRTEFMRGYKPPRTESEARSENKRFGQGVTLNDQTYKSRLPVQIGATYLLRSIDYDRSDVLVAFRVVREDTDQSLIIAWKLLKKFPTPGLKRSN